MEPGAASSKTYRFGLFETDVAKGTLTRNGIRVKLQDQPFRVLILLLERPGEVVTREELRQRLWPEGTYVDFDGSLNVILKRLRAAINDDPDNPRFIQTVPKRGYRFIAPVSATHVTPKPQPPLQTVANPASDLSPQSNALAPPASGAGDRSVLGSERSRRSITIYTTVAVAALALAATLFWQQRSANSSQTGSLLGSRA